VAIRSSSSIGDPSYVHSVGDGRSRVPGPFPGARVAPLHRVPTVAVLFLYVLPLDPRRFVAPATSIGGPLGFAASPLLAATWLKGLGCG
jgi:hypothetical protein